MMYLVQPRLYENSLLLTTYYANVLIRETSRVAVGDLEIVSHSEGRLEVPLSRSLVGYMLLEYYSFRSGRNMQSETSHPLQF